MSRIGKQPILIPAGVEIKIKDQQVIVRGPGGELFREIRPEIKIKIEDEKIIVFPGKEIKLKGTIQDVFDKKTKSFWGLTRALIANMIKGVTEGYVKELQLEGIGYRALVEEDDLTLQIGFSHPVKVVVPEGIKFLVKKNIIVISGINKELVGQTAAKIRKIRPPEPYKGKGIRYVGEIIRRKAGKRAATTAK